MTYCMYDFDLGKFSSNILILKDLYIFILEFKFINLLDISNCSMASFYRDCSIELETWKAVIPRLCTEEHWVAMAYLWGNVGYF